MRRITPASRRSFSVWWVPLESLRQAEALLARWFKFQPSEMDALDVDEMESWCERATAQITASTPDGG